MIATLRCLGAQAMSNISGECTRASVNPSRAASQVCLPGGRPVITHLSRGRRFYRGTWRHRGMVGITNAGVGTSGVPVRFNTRGEILTLVLRRAPIRA